MIPDPSFKIGVLLRLAKVAQASGHSLEEISTYETVLKILSEHNPMPTSPVSSSEAQPTSAVYVHAKKPTTSTSVNNTASSDTTAPPLEMSSVGYAGELPVFLQWNSIFCSRLVAMLKLGYYQKGTTRLCNIMTIRHYHRCVIELTMFTRLMHACTPPLLFLPYSFHVSFVLFTPYLRIQSWKR